MEKKKENQVENFSASELRKVVSEAISLCFSDNKVFISDIIGIDEVCKITGLSKNTIYKKTSNHEIPFYKPTLSKRSVLRFRRSEIEDWILRHRVGTVDEYLDSQDGL
ncbi:helix-turn-helix transcriptional regulator [Phocaeicola sp.]